MKSKQYEESNRSPSRKDKQIKKRRRLEKKAKTKDAHYWSSDEAPSIIFLSESEDSGKGKSACRNKSRKISTGGGETSKYKGGSGLQGKVKGDKKRSSHLSVDAYVISSEDDDDFDLQNSAESVASVAGKEDIQEQGEDSSSDSVVFLDEVKDMGKGKDLQRGSSDDEESVPSTTDSDSEKQSDTSEDSPSSAEDREDTDYHESSRSESDASSDDDSDASSDDEENQLSSPEPPSTTLAVSDGKENEESIQLPKARRQRLGTKQDDTFNILANSILQGDMLEKMAFEQRVGEPVESDGRLPLKFSFDDEIPEPPERSDLDNEVEDLFSEMYFALECESMDSNSQAKSDDDYDEGDWTNECDHVYVLDEEIGLICRHCRHIKTEIRYILPSFTTRAKRFTRGESSRQENCAVKLGFESSSDSNKNTSFETDGTVWDKLHGVRHTLYQHQREGFELLWRNVGGSIKLSELNVTSSESGGCIISHAPGTGKTRLAILFIESYLKVFPGSRPLIIAPVSILNTWEDEIKKWNVEFPFHNLNRDEPSGKENKTALELMSNNKQNIDVVRMLKLYSWDKEDSILGVSYSLLEKLAGKKASNSKRGKKQKTKALNEEQKEDNTWSNILLEKPGLVILDEGHTPRNQRSNIWNTLVKLETRKIIILSGTPFQNNFDELLNSLRLIRPEVAEALRKENTDLKYSRHQSQGRQSDPSKDEVQGKAINKFKAAIESFVHVHKGSILQQTLPGLRECAIMLNPHELQKSLLKKIEKSSNTFETEHKVALVSVHPQLLQLYSSRMERKSIPGQDKLEYSTLDPNEGVKTKFVLELVRLSLSLGEKVLIFSQYREPLYLIRDQMEKKFSWREGQQMFLVEGGLPQNKRQSIIHSFNDPKSEVKLLLASTKCCSEGISLIGASRVVMLDVVWNPSVAMQAISRAYRIGQTKMVYAYHLMVSGTSEADKYRRQAEKERISELVFTSTNQEAMVDQHTKPRIVASNDKILEAMVEHHSMKNIFERVIDRPKDSSFFKGFGSPFES